MASYEKRGGRYLVRYRPVPGGKQHYEWYDTAKEAKARTATLDADMARGVFVDPSLGKVPFIDVLTDFVERQPYRASTLRGARHTIEVARTFFGDRPISSIRTSDLQLFVSSLRLAPRTVGTHYGYVKAALRAAYHDGIIGRDPTPRVKLPRPDGTPIRVPTLDEIVDLYGESPAGFAVAIVLGADLGLRAGEAAGLTVDRVNFLRREVTINRQWHSYLDRFTPPKSESANRVVPASAETLDALALHLEQYGTGEHGVLLHVDGRPMNNGLFGWRWRWIRQTTGTDITMHDLRHYYASSLLSAGCSIVAVQRALGHSAASITLDTYGHLMPSDEDRIRNASGTTWTPAATRSA